MQGHQYLAMTPFYTLHLDETSKFDTYCGIYDIVTQKSQSATAG